MDMPNLIIIAIVGIVAGILGGMLGLGGAVIIIPAMVMLLGFSQQMAQGTTLMMMVLPVGSMAAYQYYQKGFVDVKVALILGIFFFVGSFFGAKIATMVSQEILKKFFAVMLLFIAVKILIQK